MFQSSTTDRSGAAAGRQGKPVKPKKRWRIVLKAIIIIVLVKTLIIITLANYFSPDNKVKRYLHAKYGSNRELSVDGRCFTPIRLDVDEAERIESQSRMPCRPILIVISIVISVVLPELGQPPWEWPSNKYCHWQASFKDDPKHIFNVWLDDSYGNRSLQDDYNEVKSTKRWHIPPRGRSLQDNYNEVKSGKELNEGQKRH